MLTKEQQENVELVLSSSLRIAELIDYHKIVLEQVPALTVSEISMCYIMGYKEDNNNYFISVIDHEGYAYLKYKLKQLAGIPNDGTNNTGYIENFESFGGITVSNKIFYTDIGNKYAEREVHEFENITIQF